MTEQLALSIETPPIAAIKAVVDVFADLGIDPLHLHVEGARPTDSRPNLSAWCRYRTDFERVCQRLQLKATERGGMCSPVSGTGSPNATTTRRGC